jgi:hypothetical protein
MQDKDVALLLQGVSAATANTEGANGETLLNHLIRSGMLASAASLLVVPGVRVRQKGASLQTSLACAARKGDLPLVQALLQACGRPGSKSGSWSFGELAGAAAAAEKEGYIQIAQAILYE